MIIIFNYHLRDFTPALCDTFLYPQSNIILYSIYMSPIDPYSGFGAGTLTSVWDLHDSLEQYTHDSDEGKVKIK